MGLYYIWPYSVDISEVASCVQNFSMINRCDVGTDLALWLAEVFLAQTLTFLCIFVIYYDLLS